MIQMTSCKSSSADEDWEKTQIEVQDLSVKYVSLVDSFAIFWLRGKLQELPDISPKLF